jgi:hypothetical protein
MQRFRRVSTKKSAVAAESDRLSAHVRPASHFRKKSETIQALRQKGETPRLNGVSYHAAAPTNPRKSSFRPNPTIARTKHEEQGSRSSQRTGSSGNQCDRLPSLRFRDERRPARVSR